VTICGQVASAHAVEREYRVLKALQGTEGSRWRVSRCRRCVLRRCGVTPLDRGRGPAAQDTDTHECLRGKQGTQDPIFCMCETRQGPISQCRGSTPSVKTTRTCDSISFPSHSHSSRSCSLQAAVSLGTNLREGNAPLILPPVPLPLPTVCWVRRST
jgi:hypothetical protein